MKFILKKIFDTHFFLSTDIHFENLKTNEKFED